MSKKEISLFDGTYNGEYIDRDGKQIRNGKGIMTYKNGNIYDGEWKNNEKDGKGIMTYKNKDSSNKYKNGVYEGNWINDQKWGEGKMTYKNKFGIMKVYEGPWAFDKKVKPETTFSKVSNYVAERITPSTQNLLSYGGLNKRKTYRKTRRNKSKKNKSSKKK